MSSNSNMFLTSIAVFLLATFNNIVTGSAFSTGLPIWEQLENITNVQQKDMSCPNFEIIDNGFVELDRNGAEQVARIRCNEGFYLDGAPTVYCIEGKWEFLPVPQCNRRCIHPPDINNGFLEVEKDPDNRGMFHKGTLVTYSCLEGFELKPQESKYRVCEKGIWTGALAQCIPRIKATECPSPKDISYGYFVHEKTGEFEGFSVGQRLHYSCNSGYVLNGTPVQQCLDDGTWSPKIAPNCSPPIADESSGEFTSCPAPPMVPHSITNVIQNYQTSPTLNPRGTQVEIHCVSKYRNIRAPCQPGKLRCVNGKWVGIVPICVPAHQCDPPPPVSYAVIYNLNPSYETSLTNKYPFKSQISYQCLPGYSLQGNEIFACSTGGCWLPVDPPTCVRHNSNYFLEVNSISAVQLSIAIGAGVWGLLLVICMVTVCRRRKPLSRAVTIAPPVPRSGLGDHASLLHHPDRLALIAFADGMQNEQGALPTYDEATRERTLGIASSRIHRPHWSNLGGRRSRNIPNPDMVHITRHGSFASHTPSTRSAADSMGSTDTVAVSEGSTNVTLDTASSHSGSQPASCRVHCGSLASFDTSSVINTEGVPLLEESELEEIQGGDNISLVVGNPSISDNASFKLSTHSADFP